ncbi:unnamed protein product [Brachionus calyciflorus]|uniref:Elongin-A n=1 Tax=Brachionus calyciflorus TaxID=104777 RepID=A0A813TG38_9BILA|nr:unnamed protein product [Brachionus calyciflorus]
MYDMNGELLSDIYTFSNTEMPNIDMNKKRPYFDINEINIKKQKLVDFNSINKIDEEDYQDNNRSNFIATESKENSLDFKSKDQDVVQFNEYDLKGSISTTNFSRSYSHLSDNGMNSHKDDYFSQQLKEDEALTKIFLSKQSKRTLFTGRKNTNGIVNKIPKLFELVTRNLILNLDELPSRLAELNFRNEPIEFKIIYKVLEKASVKQLENIEYYNPYLLVNTEVFWKKLCEEEFKCLRLLDKGDTWRDLYYRLVDEREEKFQRARNLVSRKNAEKPKERQIKEATVRFISSTTFSSSESKIKTFSTSNGPVRQILHDFPNKKTNVTSSKKSNSTSTMSKGMKATMKLMKKRR